MGVKSVDTDLVGVVTVQVGVDTDLVGIVIDLVGAVGAVHY